MKKSRYKVARGFLIFWTLFIGIGAVLGSFAMFIDPSGKTFAMDAMLPYFKKLPFSDVLFKNFIFPGVALLIVNGLTNIFSAVMLILNKKAGVISGMIFGITLMLWICIQFYIFPFNFMSTAYFIFGFLQAVTGYSAWVFLRQESFSFNENDYPHIGTDKTKLVVYFSRMGYVKKKAYEKANEEGADIYEIEPTEKVDGTLGFWWCGRYGLSGLKMPIRKTPFDISKYEHVTVCTPVWVFKLSAPVRTFCSDNKGKIKSCDYVIVHYMNSSFSSVKKEMDNLFGIQNTTAVSVCVRKGKYYDKYQKNI